MARLRWLPAALNDVARLTRFIDEANPAAARRVAERVRRAADQLQAFPDIGRRLREDDDRRELIVPFGNAADVLR
jgi:plasmid stabilization system protein ParE